MLFSEVYGSYYGAVAAVLTQAVDGTLTGEELEKIVQEKGFAESVLAIPAALRDGTWPLLTTELTTPLCHKPTMPLTTLQKRWLKSLLTDPRMALFSPSIAGLENIEPLYTPDVFVYFDRYGDGDPYHNPQYIAHFRTILTALREERKLQVTFDGHRGKKHSWECIPYKLEYSSKDDKFRLVTSSPRSTLSINLARIRACTMLEPYTQEEFRPIPPKKETLVLELRDERNALERVMLHFSHLEKETERLDESRYRVTLNYEREDETELLIRVLSFGPVLRVISPNRFIKKMRERIEKQLRLRA
ncbi:hypothetical protein OBV_31900 [Oscillibacter valericigenes Sjm18-20]|nr:hypothetical protein OBV_31900 [Oscillibacter valericigenes Sjm18-20]